MKRNIFIFLIVLFAGLVLAIHFQPASADMAPPPPAIGSDLYPSIENTNVRMVSETVLMDVAGASENPWGEARVTAEFFMQNTGDTTEEMRARFPLNFAEYQLKEELESGEEFCDFIGAPAIETIDVWVNDQEAPVEITTKTVVDPLASNEEVGEVNITLPCWAHFDVVFPPGEEVVVKIAYSASGYDRTGGGSRYQSRTDEKGTTEFSYVLGTGAGWFDTIGKADIVIRLPYDVTDINLWSCYPEDCAISGKEISWHYEDFEPQGNVGIDIIKPPVWQRVLNETANLQQNPNDGESWGRLAKAYKDSLWNSKGIIAFDEDDLEKDIYFLSKDAYEKAVELLPNDADWHYGFADLLCRYAEWNSYSNKTLREDWVACIQQVKFALDIKPSHEAANELLQNLYQYPPADTELVDLSGPEPIYLILTPQPTETATPIPSNTPIP
ncbi:MAG TPA: hypothetical protein PK530_04815, partial [Anaerolineales bacterium]|nr:hypothetical protein [Anaerolineales bacterium]